MDFLCAYKSHMKKVYSELDFLRKKINENDLSLRRDELVARIQSQLNEFMQEAFYLKK